MLLCRLAYCLLWVGPALGLPTSSEQQKRLETATVVLPSATILGNVNNDVESFGGIPYAEAPEGPLRLRPPKRLETPLGTFDGTGPAGACPQMISSTENVDFLFEVLGSVANLPFIQNATGQSEDCLSITVARPAGTVADAKLPVLFWIYGGGFQVGFNFASLCSSLLLMLSLQLGWSSMYDGTDLVNYGVEIGKPFIFVAVNYRVAGYGFMPGKEVMEDGAGNLGLLDQRMGLEWVADNIEAFGGDPDKVTIWGESAGAISVAAQMILFDGDNTYKDKPLFRGAIMNSGSIIPTDPLDSPKAQAVYDQVIDSAGCADTDDSLKCLRELDYTSFLNAVTSVPGILSYSSVAVSYLPRPDGVVLTDSPEQLIKDGKYAAVPMIIGDQEDEGTLFGLFQPNLTTTDSLAEYLSDYYFSHLTNEQILDLIATFGEGFQAVIEGSPFGTGLLNEVFPGFKRRAAILGDLLITFPRRLFLLFTSGLNPDVPSWSYLSSYDQGTPILGTFHASDILQVFLGILDNYAAKSIRAYYINFVYDLDPNDDDDIYPEWPQWAGGNQLAHFFAHKSDLLDDNFRSDSYEWLAQNIESLRY
jgi:carboxylesterase type B